MRRCLVLAGVVALLAATGALASPSGWVTEPCRGAVVTQVLPEQKAFFAQGLEAKLDAITAKEGHAALEAMPQQWGRPQPIRIAWEVDGSMPKDAAYVVKLIRTSDGKCVRTLKTKKTSVNVDSLEIAAGYQIKVLRSQNGNETPVAESAFETEDYAPRLLNVGPVNARDLGGRVGLGGHRVRQGLVFRTAGLNRNSTVLKDASGAVTNFTVHPPSMSAESVSVLTNGYGVKTDLDLRNDEETYGMTGSPLGAGVRFVHVPTTWYGKYYASDKSRALFKRCFDVFLDDANYPILFHCSGGADRTGSLAFMLNALLGVSQKELDDDWIMTHYSLKWNPKPFTSKKHYLELLDGLKALEGASLAEKAATYCRQCGITDEEIERFREKMLEPLGAHLPQLEAGFANPPDDAKLQVWWHWLTKSTTKKGIEADFKAMKEMEISTAHVFVPGFSGMPDRTGKILTPEWMDVFKYAIERANHYGIKLGFHNCPGWSASGGPWITADNSMQVLASSALDTDLPSGKLKLPDPPRKGFYEDVAVFAFPADAKAEVVKVTSDFGGDVEGFRAGKATLAPPVARGEKGGTVTVEYAAPVKARFAALEFDCRHLFVNLTVEGTADGKEWKKLGGVEWKVYLSPRGTRFIALKGLDVLKAVRVRFEHIDAPGYADNKVVLASVGLTDLPMIAGIETLNCAKSFGSYWPGAGEGLKRADIHNLTDRLAKDGTLDWTAPGPGRWRILRLGRASTGKFNSPADVAGYECDKLSKRGLAAHWPHMPRVFADLPGAKDAITTCIIDSFEAGGQNWTKDMVAEFTRRRGYDPTPYLPVIAGYAIGSLDDSHKFLEDFRRTVSDLFAENYYDYFAELCHKEGWLAATEAYGGNYDGKRCWRKADIPMYEFWIEWKPGAISGAASAAHFNGAKYVGAESFTSWPEKGRWQITPRQLREVGDPQWVNGLNRIIVHSYMQQPFLNVVPGASMDHHGSHFNRNLTWWKEGVAWSRYVARGQFLLQSGKPCAEVLAFDGTGHLEALLKEGYVYDICSVDDLARLSNGPDGSLLAPSGMRYEMLFLGDKRHWPIRQLRELRRLAEGGARIAGNCPLGTNSLADDPAAWKRECEALWKGRANVKSCGLALPAVKLFGIRAPFDAHGCLRHLRRDVGGLPLYFVANLSDTNYFATTTFAAPEGTLPELWDAADGSRRAVPTVAGGRADEARIVLDVPAHRSIFVVFRPGKRCETAADAPRPLGKTIADLSTEWTITAFDGKCPPAAPVRMKKLASWSESADERLKYFSGYATYERMLEGGEKVERDERLVLDLGDVRDVANVYIDGKFVACLWSAPYEVDVTDFLAAGHHALRVEVVNCWPNRMIGDALARKRGAAEPKEGHFPKWVLEDRPDSGTGIYTWANWLQGWNAEDEPLPAGLLGPVVLKTK